MVVFSGQKHEENELPCLVLNVRNRTPDSKFGVEKQIYTFSLINKTRSGSTIRNEDCYAAWLKTNKKSKTISRGLFSSKTTLKNPCHFISSP